MTEINPFRPTRFEKDSRPLIWVSQRVSKLEQRESFYLCGTRGSGKTSLLKAMHWRERIENKSLIDQMSGAFPGYIATYIRIPDFMSASIARVNWHKLMPDADTHSVSASFFSTLVEVAAIQELCEAIVGLRDRELFGYSPDDEERSLQNFSRRSSAYNRCSSFSEVQDVSADLLRKLNRAASRGDLSHVGFFDEFLPGELLQIFCESVAKILDDYIHPVTGKIYYKICVDDCEALTRWQQVALNTLVRRSKTPVYWLLSYVDRNYEATATTIHGQALTDADRKVEQLNALTPTEFKELCERVTEMRLRYTLNIDKALTFSLDLLLGKPTLNEMLLVDSNKKLKKTFWNLHERAKESSYYKIFSPASEDRGEIPLYQTYLIEKLFPDSASNLEGLLLKNGRPFDSYIRRKQVAAFLSIVSEYDMGSASFIGSNTVIQMSDRCIRDYLEIMAEIYDREIQRSSMTVRKFAYPTKHVAYHIQREAIRAASKKKLDGIRVNAESNSQEVYRLVEALGHLTAILQGDHTDISVLRTPERGIFIFDFGQFTSTDAPDRAHLIRSVLTRCELDGLLLPSDTGVDGPPVIDPHPAGQVAYRLHSRFSAYFNFSYRGAYEPVTLPMRRVLEVCSDPDSVSAPEWARSVARQIAMPEGLQGRLL